ncbi:14188_t:CDS:2 [Cetraspora pellucida]|uniref:14188_t:CDS:1 n=1 Tax=Cetraspora pellucida TaxID=1433469 RepID=A0ACA9L8K5_9GLOM|nr:14188_t:CDS:2 [Cetraspora pellucida]
MSQNPENTSDYNPNQASENVDSYRDHQASLVHTDSQISQTSTITGMDHYLETEDNEDDENHKDNNTDSDKGLEEFSDLFAKTSHDHHKASDNEENHDEDDNRRKHDDEEVEYSDENNKVYNKRESIREYRNDENHYNDNFENQSSLFNGERQMFDYNNNGMFNHDNHDSLEDVEMINNGSSRYESDSESGPQSSKRIKRKKLDEILGREDGETDMDDETMIDNDQEPEQENAFAPIPEGLCVECRDQEASFFCEQCSEDFCEVCFAMIHRTGSRQKHTKKNLKNEQSNDVLENGTKDVESGSYFDDPDVESKTTSFGSSRDDSAFGKRLVERSKYIPIRDYKKGQEMFANKMYEEHEQFFQDIFEIGRRHKIMNPEKMRDAYGKLMYMLMDSILPEVQSLLSFNLVKPIKTVHGFLEERGGLELLFDEKVAIATREIKPEGKMRYQINKEIRQKEMAVETLSRRYENSKLSPDDIKTCLYSIGDNNSYLRANRDCCDRMLKHLTDHFHPREVRGGYSLAIHSGRNGARLTHNHEMQYCYALLNSRSWSSLLFEYSNQTLSLWSEIQNEMFMLWFLADRDMLSESNLYRLRDTGQGLNRVQNCSSVSRAMHTILHRAQQKAGYWVGSSVIHLGDKNVPNALMFIDKYNQVSRILNPILICLDNIRPLTEKNSGIRSYIKDSFGGVEDLTKEILADFFKSAFDGSGADNFFDAGSCIDGRLTSAWNWCSLIEKKAYFPVFLLTGFVGFDGENF